MIGFIAREDRTEKILRKSFAALLFLFILFVMLAPLVRAADYDAYVYWVPPETRKPIFWTAPETGADGYEIYIWRMESAKIMYQTTVTEPTITIRWRTRGTYIAYVRAFKIIDGVKQFGEWKNTLDPTVGEVNGKPRAWVLYVPML